MEESMKLMTPTTHSEVYPSFERATTEPEQQNKKDSIHQATQSAKKQVFSFGKTFVSDSSDLILTDKEYKDKHEETVFSMEKYMNPTSLTPSDTF